MPKKKTFTAGCIAVVLSLSAIAWVVSHVGKTASIIILCAACIIALVLIVIFRTSKPSPTTPAHQAEHIAPVIVLPRLLQVYEESDQLMRTSKTPKVVTDRYETICREYIDLLQYRSSFTDDQWQAVQQVHDAAAKDYNALLLAAKLSVCSGKMIAATSKHGMERWLRQGTEAIADAKNQQSCEEATIDSITASFYKAQRMAELIVDPDKHLDALNLKEANRLRDQVMSRINPILDVKSAAHYADMLEQARNMATRVQTTTEYRAVLKECLRHLKHLEPERKLLIAGQIENIKRRRDNNAGYDLLRLADSITSADMMEYKINALEASVSFHMTDYYMALAMKGLGLAYHDAGLLEKAAQAWSEAVRLRPNCGVKKRLAELQAKLQPEPPSANT